MKTLHLFLLCACVVLLSVEPAAAAAKGQQRKTFTNSIGMEFVLIPAGSFQMGCSDVWEPGECEKYCSDEMPRHKVRISRPFYLGKYEVTQAQWHAVMGNNPSKFNGADRPVENVSWEDAQEFIRKLNAREGHNRYRLPTEAEWEYAARAGSKTAWHFGNDVKQLVNYAWYAENSGKQTHPVGQKRPNKWGLYDMYGNVWEWVQDWYGPYSGGAVTDPKGPRTGKYHAARGGDWIYISIDVNSYSRGDRSGSGGFRLALSPGR